MNDIDFCLHLARDHAYADYLCLLALAPEPRARALPLVALGAELSMVAGKTAEEMAAHIRYAWWREHITAALAGKPDKHPVLQALATYAYSEASLMHMVDEAQTAWPKAPQTHAALENAVLEMLDAPQKSRWKRARVIASGQGPGWLKALRLLLAQSNSA